MKNGLTRDTAIALFLSGLFFLILAIVSFDSTDSIWVPEESSNLKGDPSAKPIDLINKHLREVYDRQEIEKRNAENLNILTAPSIYQTPRVNPVYNFDDLPISFDQDSINELVGKDLKNYLQSTSIKRSLSEKIQDEIVDGIAQKMQSEDYKRSLADSIIQKAREEGYLVEIDDEYKVKSVKKIIKKNEPSIFDPNAIPNR